MRLSPPRVGISVAKIENKSEIDTLYVYENEQSCNNTKLMLSLQDYLVRLKIKGTKICIYLISSANNGEKTMVYVQHWTLCKHFEKIFGGMID